MALKKPSDFFEDTDKSVIDVSTKFTDLSTYSDAFKSFKDNEFQIIVLFLTLKKLSKESNWLISLVY